MAIKIGKESVEGAFKFYTGVGAFNIVAVNPNKSELSALFGREVENEPEYVGKTEDGKPQVRITFYAKTNAESKVNHGIDILVPFSFTLVADKRVGQNSGKIQVKDKYGRFAWATEEDIKTGAIPSYANGPANISAGYTVACQGEEALTEFLIAWLNIPNPANYKDGAWVMKEDASDSEIELNTKVLLKGDISEIKAIIPAAAKHLVKASVGIRTTDDGKQYHAIFTRKFVKNAVTNYSKLDEAIKEFQQNGGAPNTVFSTKELHEHVVETTTYSPSTGSDDLPFSVGSEATPWD